MQVSTRYVKRKGAFTDVAFIRGTTNIESKMKCVVEMIFPKRCALLVNTFAQLSWSSSSDSLLWKAKMGT